MRSRISLFPPPGRASPEVVPVYFTGEPTSNCCSTRCGSAISRPSTVKRFTSEPGSSYLKSRTILSQTVSSPRAPVFSSAACRAVSRRADSAKLTSMP